FRDGDRRAHQPAAHRRRGDGSRLGQGEGAAGPWRRSEIRQPGHRRITQHAALSDTDAADRRGPPGHARERGPAGAGRAGGAGEASKHEVGNWASGKKVGFGDLAADAAKQPVPDIAGLKLKDPKDFRYLGKGQVSIVDLRDITVGTAHYGADVRLPGMKYAVIARPPVTGGKMVSFDGAEAMKVSGVEKVMEVKGWPWPSKFQPLGGVAVIARNTGAAIKGRDALKVVWEDGPNGK